MNTYFLFFLFFYLVSEPKLVLGPLPAAAAALPSPEYCVGCFSPLLLLAASCCWVLLPLVAPCNPLLPTCSPCCPGLSVAALAAPDMVILTFSYFRNSRVRRMPHVRERVGFFPQPYLFSRFPISVIRVFGIYHTCGSVLDFFLPGTFCSLLELPAAPLLPFGASCCLLELMWLRSYNVR